MESRCNDNSLRRKSRPTYEHCANNFESFHSFAEWAQEQYGYRKIEANGFFWQLDKDFLGDKIYSPNTCLFAPNRVNCILISRGRDRGQFPLGVYWHERKQKFIAQISLEKKRKHLGQFDCPLEAHRAWQQAKVDQLFDASKEIDLGILLCHALEHKAVKILQAMLKGEETFRL